MVAQSKMISNERRIDQELEKQNDMARVRHYVQNEAEKDSNYVHQYRNLNNLMEQRKVSHSPQRQHASSPYESAYKDINDSDYEKVHRHKIVNNQPIQLTQSRSRMELGQNKEHYQLDSQPDNYARFRKIRISHSPKVLLTPKARIQSSYGSQDQVINQD